MIAGNTINTGLGKTGTPEDIAATNDDSYLNAGIEYFLDLSGDPANDDRVNAIILTTQQCFTAEFQKNTLIARISHPSPVA